MSQPALDIPPAVPPRVMSRAEVRAVDRRAIDEFGLPGLVLMENAARGCVDWLLELGVSSPVVVCAGRGNNAGDGFAIARHLTNHGLAVRTLLCGPPDALRGDAAVNFEVIRRAGLPIEVLDDLGTLPARLRGACWIIDALLGTGTQGTLREPFPTVIRAINQARANGARVFAIDLPSGMDCDTGEPVDPACPVMIEADWTATFVARKQGFERPAAANFTGSVRVIDIGVPHALFAVSEK